MVFLAIYSGPMKSQTAQARFWSIAQKYSTTVAWSMQVELLMHPHLGQARYQITGMLCQCHNVGDQHRVGKNQR